MYQHQDALLAATAEAEARHFWFQGFRSFVSPLIQAATGGRRGLRLLDCGCGTGANLSLLGAAGTVVGIDYTFSGLREAHARGHARLAQATASALPFPHETFDVATSFDLLQVLPDAIEPLALSELARVLKPGGALVVNVAAMPSLRGDHALLSEEARRYDRRDLRRKLAAAGFTVERITHTNATLLPMMVVVRAFQRLRGARAAASDIAVPPAPINGALSALLRVEARVVRHVDLPVGSSILCLARKRR